MAVQDIQAGVGYLWGIPGSITVTWAAGSDTASGMNMESRNLTHNFTLDELASQDGTIIETAIATKEYRDCRVRFLPKGTTRANAEVVVDTFQAVTPLQIVTIAQSTVSAYNGTFNYTGGMSFDETREGRLAIEFNARQYKNASGTFGALAAISG